MNCQRFFALRPIKAGWRKADTPRVRIALTHKLVLGSLAVAGAALSLPAIIRMLGVDFPESASSSVALAAGGCVPSLFREGCGVDVLSEPPQATRTNPDSNTKQQPNI